MSLLLLGVVDSERLESYMEFIKDLHSQFGHDCWGIIYRADVRMRTEFMDRIRRSLNESLQFGHTKAAPWSAVFAMAIREAEFWSKEVKTPATLLLARNKSLPAREDSDSSDGGPKLGAKVRKKGKAKYRGDNKSIFDKGRGIYTHSRKGLEICELFQKGRCGNGKPQSKCKAGRSHQCNLCLGPHMASSCTQKGQRN